jgi:hypothetical protein
MSADTPALTPARSWPRAELTLAVLAVLSLALIPVHITTIYSGLPAHPLFLHVPVMLIPIAALGALAFSIRPRWFTQYGVALVTITVIALASLFLTMGAGSALRNALGLKGGFGPGELIARHEHAADILRLLFMAFTVVILVTLLAHRRPIGSPGVDQLLARSDVRMALRVILSVLALASIYFVWHTGDLGAKAVWQGRLHSGGGRGFGFPGGFGSGPPGG